MAGHSELADEKDVERRAERTRHLGRDGHAAARKRQDDCVRAACVLAETPGKLTAGVDPIAEAHVQAIIGGFDARGYQVKEACMRT
jgi:hypothetical protein